MADASEKPASTNSTKHILTASECKIVGVVVYRDQAEVTRKMTIKLVQGANEVIVKNVTKCIKFDSIRVEGKGPATITEVTYRAEHEDNAKEMEKKLDSLQEQKSILQVKKQRLVKQRAILDGLADTVKNGGQISKEEKDGQRYLDSTFLGNLSNFLEFYQKWATDLDDKICQTNEELQACNKNLSQPSSIDCASKICREIKILLDTSNAGEVDLVLSYVTSNASWTPSYNIRAFVDDTTVKIQYYGMINQTTEEDWTDAKITLSTAAPNTIGTVPTLGTMRVDFKSPPDNVSDIGDSYSVSGKITLEDWQRLPAPHYHETDRLCLDEASNSESELTEIPVTEVKDNTTTITLQVAQKATIPSDKSKHKVTVGMFGLEPAFSYQSVPKKVAHAFLKVNLKNTSPYALLPGPANIFLDNIFITKTYLKAVNPSEEFECLIGIDPAVEVNYKPIHKHREQPGMYSKPVIRTTYRQDIEIKNTRTVPINVKLTDHLPRSADERIKAYLVEPVMPNRRENESIDVALNADANIEWNLVVDADSKKDLMLKYIVEHPADEHIDVYQTSY